VSGYPERNRLVDGLSAALTGVRYFSRVAHGLAGLIEGLALTTLSDDELGALTAACYRASPTDPGRGLFQWEREWLERDLPPPPALLLVGGAGRGRELRWLHERGYVTVAFDPIAERGSSILRLAYEDLVSARDSGRAGLAARVRARAPYEAVLLGWTSITHVAGAVSRLAILRALRELSDGPLLMSYWNRERDSSIPQGRAHRLGLRLGQALGGRRLPDREGDRVVEHAGYAHVFTDDEIVALAAEAGYRARCFAGPFPHATLIPL
jgi:hypothetical protein